MKLAECTKTERTRFALGAAIVVIGVLLLAGLYASWLVALFSWLRFVSRLVLPVALVALGIYVVWGVRNHAFDNLFSSHRTPASPLARSATDARVAGVCGGIAQYFGIETMFVRVVAVLLAFASPLLTLIAYATLALVLSRG